MNTWPLSIVKKSEPSPYEAVDYKFFPKALQNELLVIPTVFLWILIEAYDQKWTSNAIIGCEPNYCKSLQP